MDRHKIAFFALFTMMLVATVLFAAAPSARALQLPSHLPPPSSPPAAAPSPSTGSDAGQDTGESSSVTPPVDDPGAKDVDKTGPPPPGATPPDSGADKASPDAGNSDRATHTTGHTTPVPNSSSAPDTSTAKNAPNYNPLHAEQSVEIGTFYMHKGDLAAAADRFKYAIELRPNFAKPRLLLAQISEKQGDKAAAIRYYQEYLSIVPHAPDAAKIHSRIAELQSQTR